MCLISYFFPLSFYFLFFFFFTMLVFSIPKLQPLKLQLNLRYTPRVFFPFNRNEQVFEQEN